MPTHESLAPNFPKLEIALRSIGYTFDVAVADIIDNSIDAGAKHILVRLVIRPEGVLDLVVWDDGYGMTSDTLKEAMRFGTDISREIDRLGKFGLGLKLASLSQAKELTVVSVRSGRISGRAYPEHGIAAGFQCTIYDSAECRQLLANLVPDRPLKTSGTVVWWSHLRRAGLGHMDPEENAQTWLRRLENHLSLSFHRFLSGRARRISIELDIRDATTGRRGIPVKLDPLDPFKYPASGHAEFPAIMRVDGPLHGHLSIKAHIWPPNSNDPGYKLPGGANSRQGFYFYRNNRLIQGGGWNGLREAEPHRSLARLEIDFGADVDVAVSLDVKKVTVDLTTELESAIQKAKTHAGIDFKKYLSIAEETYRTRRPTDSELPLIPSAGLPASLLDFLRGEMRLERTTRHQKLQIAWRALDPTLFFEIDREKGALYLNAAYRRQLLHGLPSSGADLPVVKCLLYLLLRDALSSERLGPRIRETIDQANAVLVEAVKYERTK